MMIVFVLVCTQDDHALKSLHADQWWMVPLSGVRLVLASARCPPEVMGSIMQQLRGSAPEAMPETQDERDQDMLQEERGPPICSVFPKTLPPPCAGGAGGGGSGARPRYGIQAITNNVHKRDILAAIKADVSAFSRWVGWGLARMASHV